MAKGSTDLVVNAEADNEAWLEAAASRKYAIKDGKVWSGVGDALFPLPALPGFSNLPPAVRPLVFHSAAQFVTYRVGQNAEGVIADVVGKAITDGTLPSVKANDAFESLFYSKVAAAVETKLGELLKTATAEEKAKRRDTVAATAEKQRAAAFDRVIEAGITAGATPLPAKERKRGPAKPKADAVEDIAI